MRRIEWRCREISPWMRKLPSSTMIQRDPWLKIILVIIVLILEGLVLLGFGILTIQMGYE
jgi:hypothetical protein